jgi:hypothetical protein
VKSLRPEGRATRAWPPPVPLVPAGQCPLESARVRPRPGGLSLSLSLRLATIMHSGQTGGRLCFVSRCQLLVCSTIGPHHQAGGRWRVGLPTFRFSGVANAQFRSQRARVLSCYGCVRVLTAAVVAVTVCRQRYRTEPAPRCPPQLCVAGLSAIRRASPRLRCPAASH